MRDAQIEARRTDLPQPGHLFILLGSSLCRNDSRRGAPDCCQAGILQVENEKVGQKEKDERSEREGRAGGVRAPANGAETM